MVNMATLTHQVAPLMTLLMLLFELAASSNILLVPFPSYAHVNPLLSLGEVLVEKGHTVNMYLPSLYTHMANLKATSKVKVIEYQVKAWEWNAAMHAGKVDPAMDYFDYVTQTTHLSDLKAKHNGYFLLCKALVSSKILDRHIKVGMTFDLGVLDSHPLTRCHYSLMYKHGIPFVSYNQIYDPWFSNSPAMPSYVPSFLTEKLTDQMTFWQRILNVWTVTYWGMGGSLPAQDSDFTSAYVPDKPLVNINELALQSRLWLSDTNFLLDYPRPSVANEIIISWALMKEAKKLPKEHPTMDGINKTKDGIIILSLDQNIALPSRIVAGILTSLKMFPSYHIVWQYPGDLSEESIPGNVKVMPYIPLNDLLGHSKTKLLVTSADSYHQNMAMFHGVPILCLPLDAIQRCNARKTEYRQHGTVIPPQDFSIKSFVLGIKHLVQNDTYYRKLQEPSRIMKMKQPGAQASLREWIELSLINNFDEFKPFATQMPWYKYMMLDILLVVMVIFGGTWFLITNTALLGIRRLRILYKMKRKQSDPAGSTNNGTKPIKPVSPTTSAAPVKPQMSPPTPTTAIAHGKPFSPSKPFKQH